MKYIELIALVTILSLAACDRQPGTGDSVYDPKFTTVADVTQPEFVCNLSDGRKLYRFQVGHVSRGLSAHFVYLFINDGKVVTDDPVSVNRNIQSGKTSHNETTIIIPQK